MVVEVFANTWALHHAKSISLILELFSEIEDVIRKENFLLLQNMALDLKRVL